MQDQWNLVSASLTLHALQTYYLILLANIDLMCNDVSDATDWMHLQNLALENHTIAVLRNIACQPVLVT